MALTFPVALANFQNKLAIRQLDFSLTDGREIAGETRDGEIITIEGMKQRWRGSFTLDGEALAQDDEPGRALIRALSRKGASVLITPMHYVRQSGWVNGTAGTIHDMRNSREMRITGAVENYTGIKRGTFLGWQYGSNPLRYALHQVVETAHANASGITPWFEVTPEIRSGVSIGATVYNEQPVCKAIITPQSMQDGTLGPISAQGSTFDWVQTFR